MTSCDPVWVKERSFQVYSSAADVCIAQGLADIPGIVSNRASGTPALFYLRQFGSERSAPLASVSTDAGTSARDKVEVVLMVPAGGSLDTTALDAVAGHIQSACKKHPDQDRGAG